MLFDDEDTIELDSLKDPPKCVALPLKAYISLKDLWVPSELLPSRTKVLDSNSNKSYIFHTLEKKENVESLSVYFEDSEKNLDNKGVLGNPSAYTGLHNQNNNSIIDKLDSSELFYSDNSNEHVNLSKNELDNDKQVTNSLEVNNRVHLSEVQPFSSDDVTETSVAYQKSESDNVNQDEYFLDIINDEEPLYSDTSDIYTNKVVSEFLNASQTPEEKCNDSIQFMNLPQTANTNKLSCEGSLASCSSDMSDLGFQNPAYPICGNTVQSEYMNAVSTMLPLCSDIAKCSTKVVTELPIAFQKLLNECDNKQQLLNAGSTEKLPVVAQSEISPDEPVMELPIAYQRPALEESKKKQKNQKKKKTAGKKNILLGDFLQTANPDGYEDLPKKDEFYENLVRQGICVPPEILSSEVYDPRNRKLEKEFFSISENSHLKEESFRLSSEIYNPRNRKLEKEFFSIPENSHLKEENFGFHHRSCSQELFGPSVLKEKKLETAPVAANPVNDIPTTTLVLENVSKEITKENIENLFILEGYGEIMELTLESCGKFIKAFVKLILECEVVDWLIDCLNGTEPFGASGGVVKCYKL